MTEKNAATEKLNNPYLMIHLAEAEDGVPFEGTLLHIWQRGTRGRLADGYELTPQDEELLALPEWEDSSPAATVKRLAFLLDIARVPSADSLEVRIDNLLRSHAATLASYDEHLAQDRARGGS